MSDRVRNNAHRTEKLIKTRSGRRTGRLAVRTGRFVLPEDHGDSADVSNATDTTVRGHATPDEVAAYSRIGGDGRATFGDLPAFAKLRDKLRGQPQD